MKRLLYLASVRSILMYLLPAGLVNVGNVFAYVFQLIVARNLSVADVGAFNAVFALTNVITAPAAVLPFAIARSMINTRHIQGAGNYIVVRSAAIAFQISVAALLAGVIAAEPIATVLRLPDHNTVVLAFLLMCTNVLYCLSIGWFQGRLQYIAASTALAFIPALRCVFGGGLLAILDGGVDAAILSTALPGVIVFSIALTVLYRPISQTQCELPTTVARDFIRFFTVSSAASLLQMGFWNLDIVLVRIAFAPDTSGLYAVASVIGRIPYLLTIALANVLFSEATRKGYDERAARKVLISNLSLAGALALAAAVPLSLWAPQFAVLFGGPSYGAAAPILRVLCFAMALLALLQILVTYMLARDLSGVLWLLGAGLAGFLCLGRFVAASPKDVAVCLAGTVVVTLLGCILLICLGSTSIKAKAGTCENNEDIRS